MPKCPCCGNDTNKTQFEIDKKDYSKIMLYDKHSTAMSFGDFYKKAVERAQVVPRVNDAFIISQEHAGKLSINVGDGRMLKVSELVEKFIHMEAQKNNDKEMMLSMHHIIAREKMLNQVLQKQTMFYQQKLQNKKEDISVLKMELVKLQTLLEIQKATMADQRRQIDELQRELQREVFDKKKIIRDKENQEIFNRIDSLQNRLKVGKNSIGNKKLSINLGHGEHKEEIPEGKNTREKIESLFNDIQNKINNRHRFLGNVVSNVPVVNMKTSDNRSFKKY